MLTGNGKRARYLDIWAARQRLPTILWQGAVAAAPKQKKEPKQTKECFGSRKDLAATYSRGSYTTTTIGKAAFDGRVRDGNGSDHSFMATKKL